VSSRRGDDTILRRDETIFRLRRRTPETADGYQVANKNGGKPITGDSQMRTLSFVLALAFAFVVAGPSMAGSTDSSVPGIGTFSYNGSPIVTTASQSLIVAAR
jgi:hypothetical protein